MSGKGLPWMLLVRYCVAGKNCSACSAALVIAGSAQTSKRNLGDIDENIRAVSALVLKDLYQER